MIFSGGDFRFFWQDSLISFASIPQAWDSSLNTGIGKNAIDTLWITSYLNFTSMFSYFGLSWIQISLIFWIIPIIILTFTSAFILSKYFFRNNILAIASGIIYLLNSYFILIFFGGQVGVAFAYSVVPFVVMFFVKILNDKKIDFIHAILFGLAISIEVLFDPRITYVTIFALMIFFGVRLIVAKALYLNMLFMFMVSGVIVLLLHMYWILPLLLFGGGESKLMTDANVSFFSFAFFENTISFLHPNWPENIFGKVYFQRPEFLLYPIFAFSSLLFMKKEKSNILFFVTSIALVGLLGAFLAKGFNDPFGNVYSFLFNNLPGFSVFRDPTKWYVLVALSYSLLIPFSIRGIYNHVSRRFKKYRIFVPMISILIFILTLSKISDISNSIFRFKVVPEEYFRFEEFIISQDKDFRTLWIPQWQRYGYFSNQNPAIGRNEILKTASASSQIAELDNELMMERLKNWGVKYIIIPYDSEGEIFLDDRRYDKIQYENTLNALRGNDWIEEVDGFGKVKLFEVSNPKDRFWTEKEGLIQKYELIQPTRYRIQLVNAKKGDRILFSEKYDANWYAIKKVKDGVKEIAFQSTQYDKEFNSFILNEDGSYALEIYYLPQRYVHYGMLISGMTLTIILISFSFSKYNTIKPRKKSV